MRRLSIDEYGCALSLIGKSRSEDYFTHCAAVGVTVDKRVIGISYNGLKSGATVPEWMRLEENRSEKSLYYIHAESNLFSLATKGECHTVYLNISPCIACCNNIVANGVKRVVYLKEYHACEKFKKFFDFHGIEYRELSLEEKQNIKNYLADLANFKELE